MSSEVHKQQKFTTHNSGAGKTKIKVNSVPGEDSCSVCPNVLEIVRGHFPAYENKGKNPTHEALPHDPTTSPRSHLLTSAMGNRISAYAF